MKADGGLCIVWHVKVCAAAVTSTATAVACAAASPPRSATTGQVVGASKRWSGVSRCGAWAMLRTPADKGACTSSRTYFGHTYFGIEKLCRAFMRRLLAEQRVSCSRGRMAACMHACSFALAPMIVSSPASLHAMRCVPLSWASSWPFSALPKEGPCRVQKGTCNSW